MFSHDGHPAMALVDDVVVVNYKHHTLQHTLCTAEVYERIQTGVKGMLDVVSIIGPRMMSELLPLRPPVPLLFR